MNRLFVAIAIVSLAASGCVTTNQLARNNKNCCPACHVARSQSAPRPDVVRTACHEGIALTGFLGKHKKKESCDPCCGCDECCECTCGYPQDCCCDDCCDCTCGCPDECCDCTCGCSDECCDCPDTCCECSCGCPDECCDCPEMCCDPGCGCEAPCCGDCCQDDRNFCQKLIDRIASGGCRDCQGGRGSGGVLGSGRNGCGCNSCANGSPLCPHAGGYPAMVNFNPGPPVGQTAYPYYTTRGPRDFLQNNPPTIGPY